MTASVKVIWFTHDHEHRNYWLRYGLMESHFRKHIKYQERAFDDSTKYGFFKERECQPSKGVSLLVVEQGDVLVRCVVDSEDTFLFVSETIIDSDVYFCSSYNSTFFKDHVLPPVLPWQSLGDYVAYQELAATKAERLGAYFPRVVPFVPIGPNLGWATLPAWREKIHGARHRVSKALGRADWSSTLLRNRKRYAEIGRLRGLPPTSDVVLLDTLWGWPSHRMNLHRELARLAAEGRKIHSKLQWNPAGPYDNPQSPHPSPDGFPITTGNVTSYEPMLAQSRLACFSTGFHYGWRNIMTLAMMIGIPILSDRTMVEPWFGMDKFEIFWNDTTTWSTVEECLDALTEDRRQEIFEVNCAAADKYLSPCSIAGYFIETAISRQRKSEPARMKLADAIP